MSDLSDADTQARARSFGAVAEAYDRARPSYPPEIVEWLVGTAPLRILELGAGTGKLTELLVAAGHQVIASDPSPEMLALLKTRVPGAVAVAAPAESIPIPSRSVDLVVCAESFHWFDHQPALNEIARVLREDGHLALVWNKRDEGIPWVRKLGTIINGSGANDLQAETGPLTSSDYFGDLESHDFRFWQNLGRDQLLDLVRSRSAVAVLDEHRRDEVIARVAALYDDYGRTSAGMKLPYVTQCHRAKVTNQPPPPVVMSRVADEAIELVDDSGVEHSGALTLGTTRATVRTQAGGREDTGTLLIDFS